MKLRFIPPDLFFPGLTGGGVGRLQFVNGNGIYSVHMLGIQVLDVDREHFPCVRLINYRLSSGLKLFAPNQGLRGNFDI